VSGLSDGVTGVSSALAASRIFPARQVKLAPCCSDCVGGGDVRGWIGVVAQRRALGLSDHQAFERAWQMLATVNPFPATLGRVCPHPCEGRCTRGTKDGAVHINALERFLGDWALANRVPLPRLAAAGSHPESLGVIGSGPAGLSFAYQMARRGYAVTIYERAETPGGMLQFGIPQYRLPEVVLEAEVRRILDFGIALRLGTAVGRDVPIQVLRQRHQGIFIGIGAAHGLTLGIPGEEGEGAWTGTDYLARVNRGEHVALGRFVTVVGGGNTAIDAARAARRSGAEVTVLYRRSRREMPAIDAEVDDATIEGVAFEFLAAPVAIRREDGKLRALVAQRMSLGEPDASGRRSPVAVPNSTFEIPVDSVIAAVSQQPEWEPMGALTAAAWSEATADGLVVNDRVWTGGDSLGLGLAGRAIRQGRLAAEAADARFRGLPTPQADQFSPVDGRVKTDFYVGKAAVTLPQRPTDEWLSRPDTEIRQTITEAEFLEEVSRCLSCGLCFGCEQCFMYCNNDGMERLNPPAPGRYFEFRRDICLACGKCIDLCPCGFLAPE